MRYTHKIGLTKRAWQKVALLTGALVLITQPMYGFIESQVAQATAIATAPEVH
jgi:hypothetical protein